MPPRDEPLACPRCRATLSERLHCRACGVRYADVDGTARVQTLERAMEPRLHALLTAYGRATGAPVLLNTSFNLAGEPIVNRAAEGYSSFRRSGIDVLVAGSTVVSKRPASAALPVLHRETG